MKSISRFIETLVSVLAVAVVLYSCSSKADDGSVVTDKLNESASAATKSDISSDIQTNAEQAEKGALAFDVSSYSGPTFTLETDDGQVASFTDFLGRGPVALNFWGTWCPPCRREMPEFQEIYSEYKSRGVEFVGVSLKDTPAKVAAYIAQGGFTWPQVIGNLQTAQDFGGLSGVPTTIFFDSRGTELERYTGMLGKEQLRLILNRALEHEKELAL